MMFLSLDDRATAIQLCSSNNSSTSGPGLTLSRSSCFDDWCNAADSVREARKKTVLLTKIDLKVANAFSNRYGLKDSVEFVNRFSPGSNL
jgi:hypothetical protein